MQISRWGRLWVYRDNASMNYSGPAIERRKTPEGHLKEAVMGTLIWLPRVFFV